MEKVNVLIRYYNAKICEFLGIDPKKPQNLNQKINQKNSKNGSDCKFKNRPSTTFSSNVTLGNNDGRLTFLIIV